MAWDTLKKKTKTKKSDHQQEGTEVIKIMANTLPISNEEIKKQCKKHQK